MNPSSRKQVFVVLFEYPYGRFWKFIPAKTSREAKRLALNWLMKLEKYNGIKEMFIVSIKQVSSLAEVLKLEGLVLDENSAKYTSAL